MPTILNFSRYNIASAPTANNCPTGNVTKTAQIAPSSSNPLLQGLINLFSNDPGQKRPIKKCNQALMTLAQQRANDMRDRTYFSHTNPDGKGPDLLARELGYPLHPGYGSDRAANHIESIAAGHDSANAAWIGWLNSPAHKTHVLGLHPFFAEQCDFGVGYANGGQYGHYWVMITAKS